MWENVCILYANRTLFCSCGFGYLWWSWNKSPTDTERWLSVNIASLTAYMNTTSLNIAHQDWLTKGCIQICHFAYKTIKISPSFLYYFLMFYCYLFLKMFLLKCFEWLSFRPMEEDKNENFGEVKVWGLLPVTFLDALKYSWMVNLYSLIMPQLSPKTHTN